MAAAPSVPAAPPAAPAAGPTAIAIAAAEAAAAIESAAAKKADKAKNSDDDDSDETSMSDAEMLPEVELASLGEAGAATAGQAGLPCGVLPVVDAPVAVAPPVDVPVGDSGFAFSPVLLGLLGLGALGLGYLLLRNDDDDDDDVEVPIDENDPPVAADDSVSVDEDATVTGDVGANDSDPDGDDLTFALNAPVAGLTLNADGTFSFDASNEEYDDLADGETQTVTANYTVTDEDGNTDTAVLTITINGVNEAPLATDVTVNADEDGDPVTGAVVAEDADGDALTFTLDEPVPGLTLNADGTFSFDPTVNPDFQGLNEGEQQEVVANVTVTDASGETDTSTITIIVTGVNDAPIIDAPATVTVDENIPVQTVVFDADATDPDGEDVTFSISGADAAFFDIDPLTGEVRFSESPDFETRQSFTITVTAADASGAEDSQEVVININNVVETPVNSAPVITVDNTVDIDENEPASTVVVDANATDPDGDDVTFSISGEDAALFNIDPLTGEVRLRASADFETNPGPLNIIITATDADGLSDSEAVVVTINDVDETVDPVSDVVFLDNEDDDNNPNTQATFDASTDSFVFLEDQDVGSTTFITGFTSDDVLVFEEGVEVSFTSSADDPNDLQIVVNNNGILSEVILDNVLGDGIVFDEATAEASVGFDFFSQTSMVDAMAGTTDSNFA